MYQCVECGTYETIKGRNICYKCRYENVVNKEKNEARRKNDIRKTTDVSNNPRVILATFIQLWEMDGKKTKSMFECIYIDACKALGRDRKKQLMKQREDLQEV